MSLAFCMAAKIPTGSLAGAPSGWKWGGEASSKSGMFMGAGLLSALKAMSSGDHGPVSSSPGFRDGWTCSGMATSSLSRQRQGLSRPWKLSTSPCTTWRKVQLLPETGSSNDSSHLGQAYFSPTGDGDWRMARRAARAWAMAGSISRESRVMVSSTSSSRPLTRFVPKRSGNAWRMS